MFSLDETFSLLTAGVPKDKAPDLIKKCKRAGMNEIEYLDVGMDSNLPKFDKGYSLVFKTNNDVDAKLEILERNSIIMQAGIQIIYAPSFFSSKAKRHFRILKGHCDSYYGESSRMNMDCTEILNYGNVSSVCYLSKMGINGRDVINFRVGNKEFW